MRPRRRRIRTYLAATALLASSTMGCAHASDHEVKERERDREVEVLQSRVARLERRLSDMDAKLTLLTDRLAASPSGHAPSALASAAHEGGAPPRPEPSPRESGGRRPATTTELTPRAAAATSEGEGSAALAADAAPEIDEGDTLEPSDFDDDVGVDDDSSDEEVIIDANALARFALKAPDDARRAKAPTPAPKPRVTAAASPAQVYDTALARLRAGDCRAALPGFESILADHPRHHLADNALYWTGVCHQQTGAHEEALKAWEALPVRYPKSPKIPDALFGMAASHAALGDVEAARMLYHQLLERFPKAERAEEARARLAALPPGR